MSTALLLASLLAACAPEVAPDTMNAIISVESGGNPLAIHDNTSQRAYAPRDRKEAIALATNLLRQHHSLDIGIAQVNSTNFALFHVTPTQMFQPCTNLQVASTILRTNYQRAFQQSKVPEKALWEAISAYNTGSFFAGKAYVAAVVAQAEHTPIVPTLSLLTKQAQTLPGIAPAKLAPSPRPRTQAKLTPFNAPLTPTLKTAGTTRTLWGIDHTAGGK